jgi:hypothetical protein
MIRVAQWVRSLDYLTNHTSLSPIRRRFAPCFVNYKKVCTRLTVSIDKVYQLLAHGRWFSPGTPASPTIKPGQHDIADILLKVALNTKYQSIISWTSAMYSRLPFICTLISDINDVLNIVIYVYTYWWHQWCTHHGNLFVHLLLTSMMYSTLSFMCTLFSDMSDVLTIAFICTLVSDMSDVLTIAISVYTC